jgi:type IV fimbrial biogenesis protein FimT
MIAVNPKTTTKSGRMTGQDPRSGGVRSLSSMGFTLLEVLIAMAILGILVAVAVPSFGTFTANQHLVGAAEQVYGHLQQARLEAVTRNATVYVNFSADGTITWTYGMSHVTSGCDLTKTSATGASACVMVVSDGDATLDVGLGATDTGDLVLNRFVGTDYVDVKMAISSFSSGSNQFVFSPLRGSSTSGTVTLTSSKNTKLQVQVSLLGRAKLCTPDATMRGYPAC